VWTPAVYWKFSEKQAAYMMGRPGQTIASTAKVRKEMGKIRAARRL